MGANTRSIVGWLQHPWLIIGVAFGLRLAWMLAYAPWHDAHTRLIAQPPNPDTGSYQAFALALLHYWNKPGQAILENPDALEAVTIRAPSYPFIMAVLYKLLGMSPFWIVLVQVFVSVGNCALVMAVLRRVSSSLGAAAGGWFFALNPVVIDYTQMVLTETFFVFGTTLMLYSFARFRTHPNPNALRAGIGSGLALAFTALMRPGAMFLIPVMAVFGIFARVLPMKSYGLWLAGYLVGTFVLLLPWAVYNRVHYNTWRLTIGGELYLLDMAGVVVGKLQRPTHEMRAVLLEEVFARMRADGLDPNRQIFERGRYYRAVALHHIRQQPYEFASYWLRGMLMFWRSASGPSTGSEWIMSSRIVRLWFQGYHGVYLIVLIAGLWLTWRVCEYRWWASVFLLTALYFTLSAGVAGNARFRLQTFAFSLPVIAIGMDIVQQKRKSREV
ncbi:MAG: ArnT family glycosyltransferase [Fimbriimonadales bacterium]